MTLFEFPPLGARALPSGGVSYRVWAPDHLALDVHVHAVDGSERTLVTVADSNGCRQALDTLGRPGDRYRFRTASGKIAADPASRYQPENVDGPSEVVDPTDWKWKNPHWRRPPLKGRVIYELHIGTFTTEGTFAAAIEKLPHLVELGINTLEILPLAQFVGERNWGYDGVYPFAPARSYGRPEDLAHLVDSAHGLGLAVVLDVVYNHFGPVGCPATVFSNTYLHSTRSNPWGAGLNFDGPGSEGLRALCIQNAAYWLDEYRFDGLRLDSTPSIEDSSPLHVLTEVARVAHKRGAWVIAEDGRNLSTMLREEADGGLGLDGVWADDFHHSLVVALTGQNDAHFACYEGTIGELANTIRHGWLYRGQFFKHWGGPRGTESDGIPREAFVFCISNHDQVGNRALGDRLNHRVSLASYRVASLLICLVPATPLIFMGQEWAASTPFYFFADLPEELGATLADDRIRELTSNRTEIDEATRALIPDPQGIEAFSRSKLNWMELTRRPHEGIYRLYRDALRIRATHPVLQAAPRTDWNCVAVEPGVLLLRWKEGASEWLLVASLLTSRALSIDLHQELLAPHPERWTVVLDSNHSTYGAVATGISELNGDMLMLNTPGAVLLRALS